MPDLPCHWDVIVVGGGAAGLMAAVELPAGLRVLLLSKERAPRSASRWAQGGIAAVTRAEDSLDAHMADTLQAGGGLCEPEAVRLLVSEAPACVQRLLELGMDFDRNGADLSTTLEAAHSHRRVLHAQDRTGGALVDALERRVAERPDLVRRDGVLALQLLVEDGRCCGLQVLDGQRLRWLRARAVVLATGGGGHLFANTTNPAQASGDGIAMAWRAGAVIRDLEFVQFHPTALMLPGAPHFLISEAVRGEGARLVDDNGDSPVAHLPGGDLAARDAVSRALVQCMRERQLAHLWLDLRPVGPERLERQFPTILGRCRELGLEPTAAPIPVAPAAHYWMGGIRTDQQAATTLPGLYAIGEVASSGVHGANRLASNSLMECLVYARQLRQLELPAAPAQHHQERPDRWSDQSQDGPTATELERQQQDLRQLCWQVAGVERQPGPLRRALGSVRRQAAELGASPALRQAERQGWAGASADLVGAGAAWLRQAHDLRQRLQVAELLLEAAQFRQESRGGHYRLDAPKPQPFWCCHTLQQRGRSIQTEPVG
ncbi:MAG: L-aspartate oxidase [Synechococcaceae bacterium WB4_1_0192]|nr:L-aspartate oxidase [Synechococcaceae bacterium WB4_1_0192]